MNPWTPLLLATFGWSSAAVLTRALLSSGVSPFTVVPLRFGIALVVLVLVSRTWTRFREFDRRHWARGILLGGIALAIPNTLFTMGLVELPVSLGGLMVALIPGATVGAAHFLVEGERFNPRSIPGLIVSLIGTGVLVGVGGGSLDGVGNLARGVALSLVAVCFAGLGGALTRRFALEVGGDGLVIPQFTIATALTVIAMPFLDITAFPAIEPSQWALLVSLGTLATALPFTAFLIAAQVNPASRLSVAGYLVPVLAVILAVIFLGETVTVAVLVGAILIIGGVVLTERSSRHVPVPGIDTAG
jgi:drug/metabolite transporter (DMT)-like permease